MTETAASGLQSVAGLSVLVTGGGGGIGRAIADAFAEAGATVTACGRRDRPADLADTIGWRQADLTEPGVCDAVVGEMRRLDVLVNNAGLQIEKTVEHSTDDDWDRLMGINARAVFALSRAAIPAMRAGGGGSIVNIGSISGNTADPSMALYNASKAFVHGLTRSIAVDHGRDGIRCNAICPGWIMTDMVDAAFALAKDPARAKEDALARHAIGRFGEPRDIAEIALWLGSPASAFVTGQTITADGGLTAASPLNPGLF